MQPAQAVEKSAAPCGVSADVLAAELVDLQLAGFALDEKTSCMKKWPFAHLKYHTLGTQEAPRKVDVVYEATDRQGKISTKEAAEGTFETVVQWKWAQPEGKPVRSAFLWTRYESPSVQKKMGCARILSPFSEVIIRQECQLKVSK